MQLELTAEQRALRDELRAYFGAMLPDDVRYALGAPEAGTDLASLRTRAVKDGEQYVINGSKVFTSAAHEAEWIWLAARTDPDAPKHKGISIILVPTETPGVSVTPIHTVGGMRTN